MINLSSGNELVGSLYAEGMYVCYIFQSGNVYFYNPKHRQSFFPKTVGPWNQLSFADSPTLENFRTNLLSTNPGAYAGFLKGGAQL